MPQHDDKSPAAKVARQVDSSGYADSAVDPLQQARLLRRRAMRKPDGDETTADDAGETEAPLEGEQSTEAAAPNAEREGSEAASEPKSITGETARRKLRRKIHRADDGSGKPGAEKPVEKIDPKQIDPKLAQKILTDSFGALKEIDAGQVIVLDGEAFIEAWDSIYAPEKPWNPYVITKYGGLEGFCYADKQYINKSSHSVSLATVVHEMLHKNAAGDFHSTVGMSINEGVTELLSLEACTKAGFTTGNNSYPKETSIVTALMGAGLDWETIKSAYFHGGAVSKIVYWVSSNCRGSWTEIKQLLEAGDFDAAKAKLRQKE